VQFEPPAAAGAPRRPDDAAPRAGGTVTAPLDDGQWLASVYRGDVMPQLTLRALLTGACIGAFLAVANLYMTMKVGLSFGVALSACLLSYFTWSALHAASGGRVRGLSLLENNCMQSTASAAGFSTGSTLSVTFAALMILDPQHRSQPAWVIAAFTFTTAAMGVFLAIPMKRLLINQEQLPFPSGTAAATTLRNLYEGGRNTWRQATAMLGALLGGVAVGILTTAEDQFAALGRFFAWMREHAFEVHLPGQLPAQGFLTLAGRPQLTFAFEPGVAVVGLGMLVGPRVALSMLASALALFLIVAPALQAMDLAHAGAAGYVVSLPAVGGGAFYHPLRWAVWAGAALLLSASLTSLALHWPTILRSIVSARRQIGALRDAPAPPDPLAAIEVPGSWMVAGLIPIGVMMVVLQVVAFGTAWWVGAMAVLLCFFLSFVVARAAAETDLVPQGPLGKLMQLMFALISPPALVGAQASLTHNVMAAGIAVNSAGAAADLLVDLKAGYLLGGNPRKQFLAQFAGVFVGTLVCVPAWFLLVPDFAALDRYAVPAAQIWVATARALTGGLQNLPSSALLAVVLGVGLGMLLPLLERAAPRLRPYLPSAMGLGMGWVVPFTATLSLAIGSVLAVAWRRGAPGAEARYRVPVAAGLVAGDSLLHAGLAMLATLLGMLR